MTDTKTAEERSRNMSAIHSKDTRPEIYLRKKLFAKGYRYRKNVNNITGHPDIYLRKYNTAIFINGCFWHHHSKCKFAYTPKTKTDFWLKKFDSNIQRDRKVHRLLRKQHVKCLVVWECRIKQMISDPNKEESIISEIEDFLNSDIQFKNI